MVYILCDHTVDRTITRIVSLFIADEDVIWRFLGRYFIDSDT